MCKATQEAQTRELNPNDKEPHFLRSPKLQRTIPLKESAVRIIIARKRHPNKRSKKNIDGLYQVLAPGFGVQKTNQYTSVIREPGKLDAIVRNSNIAKFGNRNERKIKMTDYINRRWPRILGKSTETKILSQTKSLRGYKREIVRWKVVNETQQVAFHRTD